MSQVRTFQCPNCKEFIATDAATCRFCSTPISAQVAQANADAQAAENRIERKKKYTRQLLVGAGLVVVGVIITVVSYSMATSSPSGGHYLITYGPIIFGGLRMAQGAFGLLGELGKK